MVDVWWGITEPEAKTYRFGAYKSLIQQADEVDPSELRQAKQHGFKAQVVSSFHQSWPQRMERVLSRSSLGAATM